MKNIYKALASFQQEVKPIHKNTNGFNYKYADLSKIFEVINPLLKKHGLGFTQPLNGTQLKTVLFHIESGEHIESLIDIPQNVKLNKMNDFQVLGSAITYLRRYALSSMLGLITDDDLDASGDQQPKKQSKPQLVKDSEAWDKAVDFLRKGGDPELILKKYSVDIETLMAG
jgi:hypothetical protein